MIIQVRQEERERRSRYKLCEGISCCLQTCNDCGFVGNVLVLHMYMCKPAFIVTKSQIIIVGSSDLRP